MTITAGDFLPAIDKRTTDAFGVGYDWVLKTRGWPLGTYTVTVTDGSKSVTATTVLTAVAGATAVGY
jgi:hypothetical protein